MALHMSSSIQLNLRSWVDCTHLQGFSKSTTFWSVKKPKCHHVTHHVTSSVYAEYPFPINLIVLWVLGWPFYKKLTNIIKNYFALYFLISTSKTLGFFDQLLAIGRFQTFISLSKPLICSNNCTCSCIW